MHGAVAGEDAAVGIDRPFQVVVAHGTAAQGMRGDEMAKVEHAPGRIRDEAATQRMGVASQLFIHAGEDLLLARLVPGDLNAAVRLSPGRVEKDSTASVVLA